MFTATHLENLVALMKEPSEKLKSFLSFFQIVGEYKMLGIRLPRQTGKTTAIKEFAKGKSALVVSGLHGSSDLTRNYRGLRSAGLKYQYVIIDEIGRFTEEQIFSHICDLKTSDLLTDDFKVIVVGT